MIIGVLTREFALLASDRMITRSQNGRIIARQVSDTKCFVLDDSYLVGYSGVARFDSERMEYWISAKLAGVPPRQRPAELAAIADEAMWRTESFTKPLTFIGLGFREDASSGRVEPHLWAVSNCFDPVTGALGDLATGGEMILRDFDIGEDQCCVVTIGEDPEVGDVQALLAAAHVVTVDPQHCADPSSLVRPIAEVISKSSRVYPTVSDVVTVVNLPHPARNRREGITTLLGSAEPGYLVSNVTSVTLGAANSRDHYGPAFVGEPGDIQITGVRVYAGDDVKILGPQVDDWQEFSDEETP
jgi:hypothetical protein